MRPGRVRVTAMAAVALVAGGVGVVVSAGSSAAQVTAVTGEACAYYVNVGLFGGPQSKLGCEPQQGTVFAPATESTRAPSVSLPPEGSATPITATDPDGATAQYGPARIFAGRWPENVPSAPPSGPLTVSTQGTPAGGTVTSSVDIVLRDPPDPASPGGFGPGPVEGDELHVTCSATATSATGSTRIVNGLLTTSTDSGGAPVDQEPIPENPPVNYTRSGVITNVGDVFTVVFNEQIVNSDGSLTVNGYHMYLFGPTAVGESVGGQVTCGTDPTSVTSSDTVAPTCGTPVVMPTAPDDPTPLVPRQELVGVFDAGGLQSISNVEVTNGTVQVGQPEGPQHLQFVPGQTGPLPVTAVRTESADAAGLPMVWSFDATDAAGNTTKCRGVLQETPPTTQPGATSTTQVPASTTTTRPNASTTTTLDDPATTTTTTTDPAYTGDTPPSAGTTVPRSGGRLAFTGRPLETLTLLAGLSLVLGTLLRQTRRRTAGG